MLVEKSRAQDIIAKLKDAGAFLSWLPRNQDTGSKVRGGDLGWVDLNRLVPEFAQPSPSWKGASPRSR
ncbi:MAG: peptidylprolyl isomerase [Betaproteobacteria bacterium]|nr:peptidylprolyl isomerase [Betaproteobacteria bacterium]